MTLMVSPSSFRKAMVLCFGGLTPITRKSMIKVKPLKQSAMSCLNDRGLVVKVMEIACSKLYVLEKIYREKMGGCSSLEDLRFSNIVFYQPFMPVQRKSLKAYRGLETATC